MRSVLQGRACLTRRIVVHAVCVRGIGSKRRIDSAYTSGLKSRRHLKAKKVNQPEPATDVPRSPQDTRHLTLSERMERFAVLQKRAMELLAASPDGYRRYWERNIRKRAIDGKTLDDLEN